MQVPLGLCLAWMALCTSALAQAPSTTTVQGTVYLANGSAGSGTLVLSWPAFTTAAGQQVAADSMNVTIPSNGYLSVSLAPNLGATPAGLYYTAVYYLSDGTTTTQYWVVPATTPATLAQVQTQLMPAAQAVQAVSKAYVDEAISAAEFGMNCSAGCTLTGPLYLAGDPTVPLQAADKHYVATNFAAAVPLAGGNMTGPLLTPSVNGVESPDAGSSQTTLQAAMTAAGATGAMEIPPTYAGSDTFTNPNGLYVSDLRPSGAQQLERSVKEFGAVCDGVTDDTSALQAALNFANTRGVALTIPQGTCKTHSLNWHGESIGGMGKQVSALMGFPGQDVLASVTDSTTMLSYTHLHDLTIYVDQSLDVSCSAAEGRAPAGTCAVSRLMEKNSIFSPGGNGLTGTVGTGAAWAVGNCAIAMPAATGAGGNGLRVAEIENVEIVPTGVDPMAAQYPGAHSTHTCAFYLAQWPQWSEFRNIDIRGLNTGVAIPALPVATPAGLNADSNRWQNMTIQATHVFTAAAGSNNVLDNVVAMAGNSSATAEPPTGLILDFSGTQQGWTVRNAVVLPAWNAVLPQLTVTAAGGAVTAVTLGSEHGLGFDPYGTQAPIAFSGACTAQAVAIINTNGSIASVSVTAGGVGCSGSTTASINVAGTWDTAAPVNLVSGQDMTFFAGNLLKGNGGYTVWNATSSQSNGTQLGGGGGNLPGGGTYAALVANSAMGATLAADQFPGADFGAKVQACLAALSSTYGGTCDARNFTGSLSMGSNLTISTANAAVLLPCATISTANQIIVTAGTRNVSLRGCALRGASAASGSQGGTVFAYSGTGAIVEVGDPTYAVDTSGFHLDNAVINTTATSSAAAKGFIAYRAQELNLENLYFLGNATQTGMTLDGTGNYTGGSFFGIQLDGFQTAVNAIGHQVANPSITDWLNASTFVRLHIDCPTSGGNPIAGTFGINLQQGDGNTFTGGDVEGCNTALHLGASAQNNTIVGLRNENSNNQVVTDAGSSYNNWVAGGTIFTGQLTDNGTRNSFLDSFHRSFNGINGDWYASQQDATVTDHERLGIGLGNERGRLTEYQTDFGYRWEDGLTDGTTGEQFYDIQDLLNNVNRISIGQYLSATANVLTNVMVNNGGCYSSSTPPTLSFSGGGGTGAAATAVMAASSNLSCSTFKISTIAVTSGGNGYTSQPTVSFTASNQTSAPSVVAEITTAGSTNNQTVINAAGTGAVVLNGSTNSGTGGVVFGSGGSSEATVATIDHAGDAQFNGTLLVGGTAQSTGTMTVRNSADAEVDYYLWPGLTTSQKGSYTYKDWNGNSQWYMVKDASNNWALNSAVGGLDSFKAYQSTNSGDTYIGASNSSGVVRVNYETGSGASFNIYGGSSSTLYASFTGTSTIKFPGLAASSGHNCLQVDNSGFLSNTGSACGSSSGGSGTVNSGTSGQIAFYPANGATVDGESQVPVSAGGTGASTAVAALTSLGAQAAIPGLSSDGANGILVAENGTFGGTVDAATVSAKNMASIGPRFDVTQFGAVGNGYSTTGSITAGSNSLTVTSGSAWVVGQGIQVVNAGTAGTAPLLTSVTAISGNILTLAAAAITTVSGGTVLADDTAAIQAAFTACWNNGASPSGGVVEFPGGSHNYAISRTVYAYDSCRIEGVTGATNQPSFTTWKGTSTTGTAIPFTQFTVAANSGFFGPSSPVAQQPYSITITATNSLSAGNWVFINGCTSNGTDIDNTIAEVAAASSTSFTVVVPYVPSVLGTNLADSCTATTTTVGIAFDAAAHFQNEVKDFEIWEPGNYPAAEKMGADLYFGSRIDSGSRIYNVYADSGLYFDYYFSNGGINVDFDKGWRSDNASQIAMVYWRLGGGDHFSMATGSLSANNEATGANVMFDNQGCNAGSSATGRFTFHNMTFEVDTPFNLGFGAITMLACPTYPGIQFFLSFDNTGIYCAVASGTNCPPLALLNKDDGALAVEYSNSTLNKLSLNLPTATRGDLTGVDGYYSLSTYSHSGASFNAGSQDAYTSIAQDLTDFNFEQLWQDGIQASAFLYSDTAFAALPNATTLTVGQIVAPPAYWAATGANKRYALDVVTQAGTTGTPNYGVTSCVNDASLTSTLSCSGPSAAITSTSCNTSTNVLTVNTTTNTFAAGEQVILIGTQESFLNGINGGVVTVLSAGSSSFTASYTCGSFTGNSSDSGTAVVSSLVDLSPGQYITIGSLKTTIFSINTSNPAAILVTAPSSVSSITSPTPLTYTAPVLGSEVQLLTKSAAAPSTLAWSEGDIEENSGAAVNGVAAWVNVAAGTPGTWAGIPLGNASGQISASQISGTTGSGNVVLASGPTFTGNTTTFANGAAAEQDVTIQPGSGADQVGAFAWNNYSGTAQWKLRKDASNYLRLTDQVNSLDREVFFQNGQTVINSGAGANPVVVNGSSGGGTGGLLVENGGSSPAAVLTVSGSGNTTATGFVSGKFMIGSGTMTLTANAAAGTSPTIACAASHVCDGVSGTVTLTTGTGPATGTLATLGFPNTHSNDANCVVMPTLSGTGLVATITWSESTTNLTLTANTALAASTAYQIRYWCGGN